MSVVVGHGSGNCHPIMGGTALAFSPIDSRNAVIGTEAGGVIKLSACCSTANKGSVQDQEFAWTSGAASLLANAPTVHSYELKRYVEKYARLNGMRKIEPQHIFAARPPVAYLYRNAAELPFKAHQSTVTALHFSPFHRNLFLAGSSDGSLQLHHALVSEPITTLHPCQRTAGVVDIAWSFSRPMVFACITTDSHLHIFDLKTNTTTPILTESISQSKCCVTALAFSPEDNLLLTTDAGGAVIVWELNAYLYTLQQDETALLSRIGDHFDVSSTS